MHVRVITLLCGLAFLCLPAASSAADVSLGVSLDDDGLKSFYLAIGEHFKAPEREIVAVRKQRIPDEDLPVVFFLARRAGVKPQAIIDMRLGGKSWMDITVHFGLTAEAYYVEFKKDPGPPYGNAWGHYKHRKRQQWKEIRLTDVEVVNFVNLKFIAAHQGCSAEEVVRLRSSGKGFVDITAKIKKEKAAKQIRKSQLVTSDKSKSQVKAKGRSKKK